MLVVVQEGELAVGQCVSGSTGGCELAAGQCVMGSTGGCELAVGQCVNVLVVVQEDTS